VSAHTWAMTRALALVMFLVAAPAMADSTPSTPSKHAAPTRNLPAKAEAPVAAKGCKKTVIGRGLDRKVVCVIETEIDVNAGAPKPNVVIVHQSPRHVVGRPKSESRLKGLPQRLNP